MMIIEIAFFQTESNLMSFSSNKTSKTKNVGRILFHTILWKKVTKLLYSLRMCITFQKMMQSILPTMVV